MKEANWRDTHLSDIVQTAMVEIAAIPHNNSEQTE